MANAREIRRRIRSIANTAKVTKAMQMVASSKMKKAQEAALAGRPFAELFQRLIVSLNNSATTLAHPLFGHRPESNRPCAVVITSDKGLCGGLNTGVIRESLSRSVSTRFVTVGAKGRQILARSGRELLADFPIPDRPSLAETLPLANFLMDRFLAREFDTVELIYARFVNTLVNHPIALRLLPLSEITPLPAEGGIVGNHPVPDPGEIPEFLFEPSPAAVLDHMLPQYVRYLVHQALLSARASEHSARMIAMRHATDNAQQLVKDLTFAYNQARQESITNELLEISAAHQTDSQ